NSLLRAASDGDRCSFPRQRVGNREPDSGRRSCDQGFLSIQLQIHSVVSFLAVMKSYCTQMLSRQKSRSARNTGLETCAAHRLLSLCSMSLVTWFTISRGQIGGSTNFYFGLVLVKRGFDSGFQSRSAKRLQHIPKGAGSHRVLHCLVIGMRGEKDNGHMIVPANSDCPNNAIEISSQGDVHKNQIRLV